MGATPLAAGSSSAGAPVSGAPSPQPPAPPAPSMGMPKAERPPASFVAGTTPLHLPKGRDWSSLEPLSPPQASAEHLMEATAAAAAAVGSRAAPFVGPIRQPSPLAKPAAVASEQKRRSGKVGIAPPTLPEESLRKLIALYRGKVRYLCWVGYPPPPPPPHSCSSARSGVFQEPHEGVHFQSDGPIPTV